MKKFTIILLAAVMVLSCFALFACAKPAEPAGGAQSGEAGGAEGGAFKVGMECNYAPFNWTQTQEADFTVPIPGGGYAGGYDVSIAQKIADGLGKELEIVKTEWDGLTPAVDSGKVDAIIAGMSPTEERKATIDFSDPYYQSELVIVVKKDGPYANAASLEEFSGAKITGQLNTFHYTVIDQIPGVEKVTAMKTFPAMIVALDSGKVDGYISEKPGAVSAQASNPGLTFVEFLEGKGFETSPEDTEIAVGLKKGSGLTEQINEILAGIGKEEREQLMNDAVKNQPLSAEE